ncbi:MAG TPA: hypothetical protein VGD40_13070 [Chryseosolibacter sp.]
MKKLRVIGLVAALGFLTYYIYNKHQTSNPFDHVEWIEDAPGATERYVTFTPVSKADHKPLGPTVGADYAALKFEDLDGDGVKEAIVETRNTLHLEFYTPERHVLKYKIDSVLGPRFEFLHEPITKDN